MVVRQQLIHLLVGNAAVVAGYFIFLLAIDYEGGEIPTPRHAIDEDLQRVGHLGISCDYLDEILLVPGQNTCITSGGYGARAVASIS